MLNEITFKPKSRGSNILKFQTNPTEENILEISYKDLIEETINFKESIKYDFEIEIDKEYDISRKENLETDISGGVFTMKIPTFNEY